MDMEFNHPRYGKIKTYGPTEETVRLMYLLEHPEEIDIANLGDLKYYVPFRGGTTFMPPDGIARLVYLQRHPEKINPSVLKRKYNFNSNWIGKLTGPMDGIAAMLLMLPDVSRWEYFKDSKKLVLQFSDEQFEFVEDREKAFDSFQNLMQFLVRRLKSMAKKEVKEQVEPEASAAEDLEAPAEAEAKKVELPTTEDTPEEAAEKIEKLRKKEKLAAETPLRRPRS